MSHRPPPPQLLRQLFETATAAAQPQAVLANFLPEPPKGRTLVVGAGKASAAMAKALERAWPGELSGLVVTRYGYGAACEHIEIVEAAHPVPDAAGEAAARRIMALVQGLSADDLVIALMSGGGSALLSLPAAGLTLDDKRAVNRALLRSGATIGEMNCVRKHLSAIKGGRLGAACAPARVVSLLISDVPDDDPAVIASGPTVADPTTYGDALGILTKYGIDHPKAIAHLERRGEETPKPGDPRLAASEIRLIAAPQLSLEAAAAKAQALGYVPLILGDSLEGEARQVALVHAGIAKQVLRHGQPLPRPCVLLSGGETTVTIANEGGKGGRNGEFALALAVALERRAGVYAIACDTDGIDGTEDNAGAIITPTTLTRAEGLGLDAKVYLARNDSYTFFERLGDLVICGPTHTNVNDFRALLIDG